MTDFTASHIASRSDNFIMRGLRAVWVGLVRLGEASSRARALEQIAHISDQQLETMGTTRHDLVMRVVTNGRYL